MRYYYIGLLQGWLYLTFSGTNRCLLDSHKLKTMHTSLWTNINTCLKFGVRNTAHQLQIAIYNFLWAWCVILCDVRCLCVVSYCSITATG
jgi:hypothetical protein